MDALDRGLKEFSALLEGKKDKEVDKQEIPFKQQDCLLHVGQACRGSLT